MLLSLDLFHVPSIQGTYLARLPLKVSPFVTKRDWNRLNKRSSTILSPQFSPLESLWWEEDQVIGPHLQPVTLPRRNRGFTSLLQQSLPPDTTLVLQHSRVLVVLPQPPLVLAHNRRQDVICVTRRVVLRARFLLQHRVVEQMTRLVVAHRRVVGQVTVGSHQATRIGSPVAR